MDPTVKPILTGLLTLVLFAGGIVFISHTFTTDEKSGDEIIPTPTLTPQSPTSTTPFPTPSPRVTATTIVLPVRARIDSVDTTQLSLGRPSYAYITISNTGTVPITKERVEITAGKDFGFLIGYQSRLMIQEFYDSIEPGSSNTLQQAFNLPHNEGFISLEGVYEVTIKVYANDWYQIGEWRGKIFLKG